MVWEMVTLRSRELSFSAVVVVTTVCLVPFVQVVTAQTSYTSPTYGAPTETFITGSKLILFGKDVPPTTRDGVSGLWIVKTAADVTVNGVVYMSLSDPEFPEQGPIDDEIIRSAKIMSAAAEWVWTSRETNKGSVVMNGKEFGEGDTFDVELPEYQASAHVALGRGGGFRIDYGKHSISYPPNRPRQVAPEEAQMVRLDAAYQSMVKDLKSGYLVVKGRGYSYGFPLSAERRVRESLAKFPAVAEVQHLDSAGQPYYKPITNDSFFWTSEVIRDVLGN